MGEAVLVGVIAQEAQARTWQAAVWLLERQFPDRWARASQRELVDPEQELKDAEFDPFREFDELAEARRKKLSGEVELLAFESVLLEADALAGAALRAGAVPAADRRATTSTASARRWS